MSHLLSRLLRQHTPSTEACRLHRLHLPLPQLVFQVPQKHLHADTVAHGILQGTKVCLATLRHQTEAED